MWNKLSHAVASMSPTLAIVSLLPPSPLACVATYSKVGLIECLDLSAGKVDRSKAKVEAKAAKKKAAALEPVVLDDDVEEVEVYKYIFRVH